MFSVLSTARKAASRVFALVSVLAIAACQTTVGDLGGGNGPKVNTNKPIPVALLIPKSHSQAGAVAASLENSARLAIASLDGVNIDLRVYDTAGSAAKAGQVAQMAVDDGAKIILGPLYGDAANEAGRAVADEGINVLSFSNNTSIAGNNVFVLGPTFQNTANRLMSFARSEGKKSIVLVHADTVEGQTGKNAIVSAAGQNGISVASSVSYELSMNSVVNALPTIRSAVNSSGADSVFISALSAGALPLLLELMPESGIDPTTTQYIGLSRWDIPAQTLALKGAQGGWFTMPNQDTINSFNARYAAAYGGAPHPLGGLAFDGIAAIGALAKQGRNDALTSGALTQSAGFQGTGGVFRLLRDGTNQRGLAVATVQNNQVVILDRAPTNFGGFGF